MSRQKRATTARNMRKERKSEEEKRKGRERN